MMQNSLCNQEYHFPDVHIVNILSYVDRVGLDPLSCKILSSNLNVLNELAVNVSVSCSEKLSNCLQRYLKTIDNREDPGLLDGNEIQQLIVSILNLLERSKKLPLLETLLDHLLEITETLLSRFNSGADVSRSLNHRVKLLDLLLTYIGENKLNEIFSQEMKLRFDKFFLHLFVKENGHFLSQALSVSLIYLKATENWTFLREVLVKIIDLYLSRDEFIEVFVMIISFFVDSVEADKFTGILELYKFWRALKKCFTCGKCERKHVNHLLKFSVSNLHHETIEGVWHSSLGKNYHTWWRNYFIISEILEEKQTHLVLPVFPIISDLLDNPVVQVDAFWILILFQSALEHDSRTIRLKAFLLLLNGRQDLYQVDHFPILLQLFVNTANDSALYKKLLKANEFEDYGNSIIAWINFFVSKGGTPFLEVLFSTICGVKWSPIPLYYILDILNRSGIQPCLKIEVIQLLKDTISNVTRYHHIVIRAAIQCSFIKFVTTVCQCDPEDLTYLYDFVNYFNEEECLLRGVTAWSVLTDYLINSAAYHSAEKFISEKITSQIECDRRSSNRLVLPLARFILLLHDSLRILDKKGCLCTRIENMILSFSSALQNPYLVTRVQDNYLLLLVGIYSHVRNDSQVESRMPIPGIVICIEENSPAIFSYTVQRMMKSENNAELLDFYEFCLRRLQNCVTSFLKNLNSVPVLNDWWNKSLHSWHAQKSSSAYCCAKILLWILKVIEGNNSICHIKKIDSINSVLKNFIEGEQPSFQNMNNSASNVASNYANTMWSILELSLKMHPTAFFQHLQVPTVFDFVLNTFDWVRKENLFLVLKTLKHLLSLEMTLKHEEMILQLMDDSWKRVEEIHSTPYYNDCLKYWIAAFFQKSVLQLQTYHTKIVQYMNILIEMVAENGGQSFRYIIFVLNEFDRVEDLFALFPQASDILIKIYCTTHADREDQRMESRTEEDIRSSPHEVSVNQIKKFDADFSSEIMRLKALNIILKLGKTESNCLPICLKLSQSLIGVDKNLKKRYFNDSVIHRIKHKKLQLLLIIETIASQKISDLNSNCLELPKLLYDSAISSVLTEPHQPSVRYMLEWLIVRLILHYPSFFHKKFWDSFSEASEERIGSICSFISVAFHVSNVSKDETFVNLAVKSILPWAMGQHFNARLYAQTVLVKLINMSDALRERYEVVEESLNNCLRRGNAVKNAIKLQQDFYFCHFHPLDHFSLLMVLWDLPRLSGICREEWLSRHLYEKYLLVESNGVIRFYHEPDLFCSLASSSWIAKAAATNNYSEHEATSDANVSLANPAETQKKFIPVETISTGAISSLPKNAQKLIVVASLIDRAPNLGGLTRTCEIFAVSQLVVDNLDITRSKEFTSLSITAEKHVNLIEVKRQNVYNYLRKLREDDFCIVGVEQTTNSKKLEQFVFPLKSVLVLGNEKEGISASLLPFLDVCVEIPQSGVIRSLNVHVSASILIWEYSKQHLLKPN